jgi:hypothetical protein
MLPKEHGAYGQLAFPALTAFLVAGASPAGLLIVVAAVAGFLAHEPAAVLIGLRGVRAQRDLQQRAAMWLACTAVLGTAAGIAALVMVPTEVRWSFAVPLAPALLLAAAASRGQEKSWYGETAASLAFSGVAVPVSLAASASLATALTVAIPFASLFVASTLAVRVMILRARGGGNAQATAATRRAALSVAAGASTALALVVALGLLPASALVAAAPGLLMACVVATYPPTPHRLRTVGWSLIAVSLVTASIVVATT